MAKRKNYKRIAVAYAKAAAAGEIIVGAEVQAAAKRFLDDLERKDLVLDNIIYSKVVKEDN